MGGNWLAACAVCLVLSLDGFHMVNHVTTFCLSSLNPKKFLQIADQNTQSCEQTNRMANKHRWVLQLKAKCDPTPHFR